MNPDPWTVGHELGSLRAENFALRTALDAITAACTSALADHRRGCPTYGLVSAGLIAAIAEEAKNE